MKKPFILVIVLALLISNEAKSDRVIIKGDTLSTVFFSVFDNYPGVVKLRERLKDYGTHCTEDNCSFLPTWKIINNRLMLAKIENCWCNQKKQTANLKSLFRKRVEKGMMPAYWYTGEIWVTKDQPTSYKGMFAASWPRETRLIVKKGMVISVKNLVYPVPEKTIYYKNDDSLRRFIYTHLDWKKFHNLPEHAKSVYFSVDQDTSGYIIGIKKVNLSHQTFNKSEMEEINRVLGLLKWPLYYCHGKPIKSFEGVSVTLSKGLQDKYSKD